MVPEASLFRNQFPIQGHKKSTRRTRSAVINDKEDNGKVVISLAVSACLPYLRICDRLF